MLAASQGTAGAVEALAAIGFAYVDEPSFSLIGRTPGVLKGRVPCLPAIYPPVPTLSSTGEKRRAPERLHGRRSRGRRPSASVCPWSCRLAGRDDKVVLADAQVVIAREHGFESWPTFAKHIDTLTLTRTLARVSDPVSAFIEAASAPPEGHASGTLDYAEMILARYPDVARSNIYVAALLGDEGTVRGVLGRDAAAATTKGGPFEWDALTYLCFSRYLRLDVSRSEAFVRTARALLDAGANARSGWYATIDHPNPRPVFESAIYGAAGVARHPGLTRLLLERGADANDEETPYHVPETTDNTVMRILLESGTLNADSLTTMLLRKADWHDAEGLRLLLAHGADPNRMQPRGHSALHHAVGRDNPIDMIELLLEHGADPWLPDTRENRSAAALAARRGQRAVLEVLQKRGTSPFGGVDRLIAACAFDDREAIRRLIADEPALRSELIDQGGTLLAEFAGGGNAAGVRNLLDCGVSPAALYGGDAYFGIASGSTALHVAAWRARPDVVKELIARGTPVNVTDGKGRTALAVAVNACVDSFWTERRSPESVKAQLDAGASVAGVESPSGYDEVDVLLREHVERSGSVE